MTVNYCFNTTSLRVLVTSLVQRSGVKLQSNDGKYDDSE